MLVRQAHQDLVHGPQAAQRPFLGRRPADHALEQREQPGRVVERERQDDGFPVVAGVRVVRQLLLLLHPGRGRGGFGRHGVRGGVFPEGDDAVSAAGDEGSGRGIYGEGPDAVGVVVERACRFAGAGVPDLDEAVTARGSDLHGPLAGLFRGGRKRHPEDFEDAVGVAFQGAETAVVGEAPDLDGLVTAAGEYEAMAGACGTGAAVTADGWSVLGGEFHGPDAATVAAENALDFAFLDGPDLDGAVLGRGGEEGVIVIDGYSVDVFIVSFTGIESTRCGMGSFFGGGGTGADWGFRDFPSFDRLVLRASEKEGRRMVKWT
ncbi:MAG: hypothetical protein Q9193_005928 [Seirophora villosa]